VIVDTSAILAIVFKEPGYESLIDKLLAPGRKGVGTPTLAEAGLVLTGRLEGDADAQVSGILQQFEIVPVPFGEGHWRAAVEAFRRFGKGRHPAALSFGDCLSYATAKLADRPLLFVGEDFSKTDLRAA
jgi:ribonuclease VapC